MVSKGRLGQKSGAGFYEYPVRPKTDQEKPPDPEEISEVSGRLKLAYISSLKRFAMQSHTGMSELNDAMMEYLGSEKNLLLA